MRRDILISSAGENLQWVGLGFQVLTVYEALRTGLRGIGFINTLQAQMTPRVNCSPSVWQGGLLGDPLFREKAPVEACEADLIILSVHEIGTLPEEFHELIEPWLDLRPPCRDGLVVDELSSCEKKNYSARTYLQYVAKEPKADLFTRMATRPLPSSRLNHKGNISSPPRLSTACEYRENEIACPPTFCIRDLSECREAADDYKKRTLL